MTIAFPVHIWASKYQRSSETCVGGLLMDVWSVVGGEEVG